MTTPGSNILKQALRSIKRIPVTYLQFSSRSTNSVGVDVTTYRSGITITTGTFQPVKRQNYQALGLDFGKRYGNWYVPELDVIDIERDSSGDAIEVLGRRWQLVGSQDWYLIDGWKQILCQDIGKAPGPNNNG